MLRNLSKSIRNDNVYLDSLVSETNQEFPGDLFLDSNNEESGFFHRIKLRIGGDEAVLLQKAVVLKVGKDSWRDTPDMESV